eukprot:131706_1
MAEVCIVIKETLKANTIPSNKRYTFKLKSNDRVSTLKTLIYKKRKIKPAAQTLTFTFISKQKDKDHEIKRELKDDVKKLSYYNIDHIRNNVEIHLTVDHKINDTYQKLDIQTPIQYHSGKATQHDDDCRCGGFGPSRGICRNSWIWNCCGHFREGRKSSKGCKWRKLSELEITQLINEWLSEESNALPVISGYIQRETNQRMEHIYEICFSYVQVEIEWFHSEKLICNTHYCCLGKKGSAGCKKRWKHPQY